MVCPEHWADSNDYTDLTQVQHLPDQLNQRAIGILSSFLLHPIAGCTTVRSCCQAMVGGLNCCGEADHLLFCNHYAALLTYSNT